MVELLAKLESYRIFNYLYPGALFMFACNFVGVFELKDQNLLSSAFLSYFAGMTLSRIGSLLLEKPLRFFGFIKHAPYADYVRAEHNDDKIKAMVEDSNSYRTIVATLLAIFVMFATELAVTASYVKIETVFVVLMAALVVLYLFALRKQVDYIRARVEVSKDRK